MDDQRATRFPRWDDESEDPDVYWERKLQEARRHDEVRCQVREQQTVGRPFLVPKVLPP